MTVNQKPKPMNGEKYYYPSNDIVENATVKEYDLLYKYSVENREKFWSEQAEKLHWYKNGTRCWMTPILLFISGLPAEKPISFIMPLTGTSKLPYAISWL